MTANYERYELNFKIPGGTSRGVLKTKETFILTISQGARTGIGECGLFRGLSSDDVPDYEQKLTWLCNNINADPKLLQDELIDYPSIWFGYEQAQLNLQHGEHLYFPSEFTSGKSSIKINGLIWMGDKEFMIKQIDEKLSLGFTCLKLKIGVNWLEERKILETLRQKYPEKMLELRVDANGGFSYSEAPEILQQLSDLKIHSIEQPIKAGQWDNMKKICKNSPVPVALDEELIGINEFSVKKNLLETIQPQYIILKPSLCGGFYGTDEWIKLANDMQIGWWITSALESNIGLNAIAQYTYTKNPKIPQGLGTGGLFTNNFDSPLQLHGENLSFQKR